MCKFLEKKKPSSLTVVYGVKMAWYQMYFLSGEHFKELAEQVEDFSVLFAVV